MLYLIPVALTVLAIAMIVAIKTTNLSHWMEDRIVLINLFWFWLIAFSLIVVIKYYESINIEPNNEVCAESKRLVTYSVYIDGVKNNGSEKVLDVKLVHSKDLC